MNTSLPSNEHNKMSSDSDIRIIILRKNSVFSNTEMDEKICIFYLPSGMCFKVDYYQPQISKTCTTRLLYKAHLLGYITTFLDALKYDTELPEYIQFDVPAYSSVLIKMTDIQNYIPILSRQIDDIILNIPKFTCDSAPNPST